MKSNYTLPGFLAEPETVKLWHAALSDIQYKQLAAAVMSCVTLNERPPVIATLRRMCVDMTDDKPTWDDAFKELRLMTSAYGYYRQEEMLQKLPKETRRALDGLGGISAWFNVTDDTIGTFRAQFRDIYNRNAEKERKRAQIPPKVLQLIDQIGEGRALING